MLKKYFILLVATMLPVLMLHAQNLEDAKDLIDEERYSSAETILEKNAGDPETNYLLVKVYLEQDKEEDAEKFIPRPDNGNA